MWLYHPVGEGPAGPPVSREVFTDVWTNRPVLLVGLGDSVTAGFGARPSARSYFNRIFKNPDDEFTELKGICLSRVLPNLQAENLALSGSTSIENIDVILPKLDARDPDTFGVVVMTTGGNDIIHNYGRSPPREGAMYGATFESSKPWIEDFRGRLDSTIDRIEGKFPGAAAFSWRISTIRPTESATRLMRDSRVGRTDFKLSAPTIASLPAVRNNESRCI